MVGVCDVSLLFSVLFAVTCPVWWRSQAAPLGHTANTAASLHTLQGGSHEGEACGNLFQSGGRV